MATATEWKARYDKLCREAAEKAFRMYCANPHQQLWLYYSPADAFGKWGELCVTAGRPRFMELGATTSIPRNATVEQLVAWVRDKARHLPLIGS